MRLNGSFSVLLQCYSGETLRSISSDEAGEVAAELMATQKTLINPAVLAAISKINARFWILRRKLANHGFILQLSQVCIKHVDIFAFCQGAARSACQ